MGTVSRMYDNYGDAAAVVRDLEAADVPHRDISLVANEHAHGRDAVEAEGSSIPSYSLRHKRIEQPQDDSGRNRGGGIIGRSLRSCGDDSPHLDVRRVCLPTSIRGLLWSSGSASRTRQSTTF